MRFWKYHGLGNDFVVVNGVSEDVEIDPAWCRRICDRHFGIGADGVLYVLDGENGCDATMRVINSDGSEPEMCGNGIRCVAKFARDTGLVRKDIFKVWTGAGAKSVSVSRGSDGNVKTATVNMGAPVLEGREIPIDHDGKFVDQPFECEGVKFTATAVSMGNPHFITFDGIGEENIRKLGPALERHPFFPNRTNVEFASMRDGKIYLDVYERGAGWTLACGTGACAAAVAAVLNGYVSGGAPVEVRLPGGWLTVKTERDLECVYMEGPAALVAYGEIFVE